MKINLKPSFKYQIKDMGKSAAGFFVIMSLIMIGIPLIIVAADGNITGSFSGYGIAAAIFMFVIGIVSPRTYVRLGIQLGISRKTSFIAQIASVLALSLALAAAGEILTLLVASIPMNGNSHLEVADMYQLIYHNGESLNFMGHIISICFNMSMSICGYICGMFFTLMFWRLNKLWTWVVAIGMVVFANVGVNFLVLAINIPWIGHLARAFADAVVRGPAALIIFFLVVAAVCGGLEWLMLRKAFIKASK